MLETDSTPDRWINFVLQNGWRLKAQVDEETGDLSIALSNEKGNVIPDYPDMRFTEEVSHTYKLTENEEENN
jgi:hypothetical protein